MSESFLKTIERFIPNLDEESRNAVSIVAGIPVTIEMTAADVLVIITILDSLDDKIRESLKDTIAIFENALSKAEDDYRKKPQLFPDSEKN